MKLGLLALLLVGVVRSAPTDQIGDVSAGVHPSHQTAGKADRDQGKDLEGELTHAQAGKSQTPAIPHSEKATSKDALPSPQNEKDLTVDTDDDVKIILKAFFENLKNHPAVVEALIEEESERLLQVLDNGDVTLHSEETAASLASPSRPMHGTKDERPVDSDRTLPVAPNAVVASQSAGKRTPGQGVPESEQGKQVQSAGTGTKTLQKEEGDMAVPRLVQAAGSKENERSMESSQQNDKITQTVDGVDMVWDRESLERLQNDGTFLFPLSGRALRPRAGDVIIPDLGMSYNGIDVAAETPNGKGMGDVKASAGKSKDGDSTARAAGSKDKGQGAKDAVGPEGDGGKSAGKSSGAKSGKAGQSTESETGPFYYYYSFYDEPVENSKPLAAGAAGGKQEPAKITSPVRIGSATGLQDSGKDNSYFAKTAEAVAAAGELQSPTAVKAMNENGARSGPKAAINSIPDVKPAASDVETDENELKDLVMKSIQKAKANAM